MTLSEQEKREVRGTDPRAAALLREVDSMPDDLWERLHGTVRYLDSMTAAATAPADLGDRRTRRALVGPGLGRSVDPEHDAVRIGDVEVRRGSRVILRPGVRRADAYDLFLAGRTATVAAVLHDVDHGEHLAVTVDDDPGSDLKARTAATSTSRPTRSSRSRCRRGEPAMTSVLVACVGNIFKSDDGFGVEVAAAWRGETCRRRCGSWTSASAACTSSTSCSTGTTCWCSSTRWPTRRDRPARST